MEQLKIDTTKNFDPRQFYHGKPLPNYGEAELFIGDFDTIDLLAGMSLFCTNFFNKEFHREKVKEVVFILPPVVSGALNFELVLSKIIESYESLFETKVTEKIRTFFTQILKVQHVNSMNIDSVIEAINGVNKNSIILVPFCSKYKENNKSNEVKGRRLLSGSYESKWVNDLVKLSTALLEEAEKNDFFLVLASKELPPIQKENQDKIIAVDNLFPAWLNYENSTDSIEGFQSLMKDWSAKCINGQVDTALRELEESELSLTVKEQIRIQLLCKAGNDKEACEIIKKQIQGGTKFSPESSINYSRIAFSCHENELAAQLIEGQVDSLFAQKDLETLLIISNALKKYDIAELVFERLNTLFSDSDALKENKYIRIIKAITEKCYESNRSDLFGLNELELNIVHTPELVDIEEHYTVEEASIIRLTNSLKSFQNKDYATSLFNTLKVDKTSILRTRAIFQTIYCIEKLILDGLDIVENEELINLSLHQIIEFISHYPDSTALRGKLFSLVSIEGFGKYGVPSLASMILRLITPGLKVNNEETHEFEDVSNEEATEFFKKALDWMEHEKVIEIGVSRFPKEIIPTNVDGYLVRLKKMLNYSTKDSFGEELVVDKLAYVICLLAPFSSRLVAEDLQALKLLANYFWSMGKFQKSRDLAEQILELAENNEVRQKIGWSCYSDIYLRQAKPLDALIGACCSLSIDTKVDSEYGYEILYLIAKITRDLFLFDITEEVLTNGFEYVQTHNVGKKASIRLRNLKAGIELYKCSFRSDKEAIEIINELISIYTQVIEIEDEIGPTAILLYQAREKALANNIEIATEITEVIDSISSKIPSSTQKKLTIMSKSDPTSDDIFSIYDNLEIGIYSQDRPEDLKLVKQLIKRYLTSDTLKGSLEDTFFLLDLLGDSATSSITPQNMKSRAALLDFALDLSSKGYTLLLLALNNDGNLVGLIVKNGALFQVQDHFPHGNLHKEITLWQESYPHKYGDIDEVDGNNEFYNSMSKLDIPIPDSDNVIVCAEPKIQKIPLNILLKNGELLGQRTKTCYVPSLSWLKDKLNKNKPTNNKNSGWISNSNDSFGTLEIAYDRLQPTFEKYEFDISTDSAIPLNCSNSQVVVITAHGGLSGENGYFKKVADEQNLYFKPSTLVTNIHDSDLIILFVCSGGKLDESPYSDTTYGLPKLLLENSCDTVIASPWPLDSFFIHRWLEVFMAKWNSGSSALDACFYANKIIMEENSYFAGKGLAMTLFGNPLTKK